MFRIRDSYNMLQGGGHIQSMPISRVQVWQELRGFSQALPSDPFGDLFRGENVTSHLGYQKVTNGRKPIQTAQW